MQIMSVTLILLASILSWSDFSLARDNHCPKIVVIGAGIAGLTASYRLHQQGLQVDLYEARNRVGGRIFSAIVDGHVVELGGQNIYDGGDAYHLLRLIKELNLELIESFHPVGRMYYTSDFFAPETDYYQSFAPNATALAARLDELAVSSHSMKDILLKLMGEDTDFYKILSSKLAGYEGNDPDKLSVFYKTTLYHMLLGASSFAHQSNQQYEKLVIKGGNSVLTQQLAQALGNRVHLKEQLTAVAKEPNGSFVLSFKNGHTVSADILILALPAPAYKDIAFGEGVIASDHLAAVRAIEYGTNAKIMIPLSGQSGRQAHYLNERIGTFPDAQNWVVTLYYRGKGAYFTQGTIIDSYGPELPMLHAGLGDTWMPKLHPVYARDEQFACYTAPVGYSWPSDPLAQGSYSYIAQGQEGLAKLRHYEGHSIKSMFVPLDHKLYFAGEHTSGLLDVSATMEAACQSGDLAALLIVKSLSEASHQEWVKQALSTRLCGIMTEEHV